MELQMAITPLMIAPLEDPRPDRWYYGMRCACMRLLALSEDLFAGKGAEEICQQPGVLAVRCTCGRVSPVGRLRKFQQQ